MSKKNMTRRALFASVISLILCCAMLVGTTFAWFTDSVTSGKNQIVAGNLDIELYWSADYANWQKVTENTNIFEEGLWEPGHTEVVYLQIKNEGTLNLKYQLGVGVVSETGSINKDGNSFKLSDYIQYGLVADASKYTDRAAAVADVKNATALANSYSSDIITLAPNVTKTVALVVYMPETVGNEANYRTGEAKPTILLGVNLYATQVEAEEDSFGDDYDAGAELLPDWNGAAGEVPAEDESGVITISTAEELAGFAAAVNGGESYVGKTIKLASDLDLANKPWTPIGACDSAAYFQGTFDGQNYTIYGLNVDKSTDSYKNSTAGLFGWIDAASATIKNVTISGATVKGSHWVGGLVGYMTGEVSNCHVVNSTITGYNVNDDANGDKIGGLVGYMNSGAGKLDGNSVSNTKVTGYRDVAGLAGAVATTNAVTNNKVTNVTVTYESDFGAAIVSAKTAVVVNETNVATNVTLYKGSEVAEGILKTGDKTYSITSKAGLKNMNAVLSAVPHGEGSVLTVDLMTDIDMSGETWNPADVMWVVFNGNNHTISNINAGRDSYVGRSGFWSYAGAVTINDLTLENVTSKGTQAGTFAGSAEGLTLKNCYLKGTNTVTWEQNPEGSAYIETANGIGAICGVTTNSNMNVTIDAGTVVTVNKNTMDTVLAEIDSLVGYKVPGYATNSGTVINNGKVNVIALKNISDGLLHDEANATYYVSNANGLAELNKMMSAKTAGRNVVVNLTTNIDFSGKTWTPVDSHADSTFTFSGLNGNGHTISNLTINGQAMFTRFAGNGDVVIKDVTFDNAVVTSSDLNTSILTVQTYQNVLLDNVDVKNSSITGAYKVAPLIATVYNESSSSITATLKNCDVSNTTVKATQHDFCTTGMVAFVYESNNDKVVFENCTVSGVKLYAPSGYTSHAWVYVNDADTDDCFNVVEGVTVTNCTFENI